MPLMFLQVPSRACRVWKEKYIIIGVLIIVMPSCVVENGLAFPATTRQRGPESVAQRNDQLWFQLSNHSLVSSAGYW